MLGNIFPVPTEMYQLLNRGSAHKHIKKSEWNFRVGNLCYLQMCNRFFIAIIFLFSHIKLFSPFAEHKWHKTRCLNVWKFSTFCVILKAILENEVCSINNQFKIECTWELEMFVLIVGGVMFKHIEKENNDT